MGFVNVGAAWNPPQTRLPNKSAIYQGDALQLLEMVAPNSVRLVLSDPPYNVSQDNNLHTMGRRGIDFGQWDKTFDQIGWLEPAVRTLMPGGSMVVFNDWKLLGGIAAHLQMLGLSVKRILRWKKNNPFPRNIERSFVQDCEYALWAVAPGGTWVFNKRKDVGYERGEFEYPVVRGSTHPTKKPNALFSDIIKILSNPKDLVLDPFVGCYDGQTSVMTQRGFVSWPEVTEQDLFATRSEDGEIAYVRALRLVRKHYDGAMHRYEGRSLDLLVTPDHNMLFREHHSAHTSLIPSEKADHRVYHIPNTARWTGPTPDTISVGQVELPALPWLKLLGLYIAEGCVRSTGRGHGIYIKQSKTKDSVLAVREIINGLRPIGRVREHIYGQDHLFVYQERSVHDYCASIGRQPVRRIPRALLALGPSHLNALLEGLKLGDGNFCGSRHIYWTSSPGLAEDVAEIFIKLGLAATIDTRDRTGKSHPNRSGRLIQSHHPEVSVRARYARETKIDTYKMRSIDHFSGMVYCASVPPNHTLLVKRNGKIAWCGNSGTTSIVAEQLGRRHIGFEIDADFFNLAVKELSKVTDVRRIKRG
jgi:site-specific DNA-methyltransferase (adenine-specific)